MRGSGGNPLTEPHRRKFEAHLGTDLSGVRVHTDATADAASSAISAKAFAHRDHVFFASGKYDPESPAGTELLGHELAHVAQFRQGRVPSEGGLSVSHPGDPLEREAAAAGRHIADSEHPHGGGAGPTPARIAPSQAAPVARDAEVQRQEANGKTGDQSLPSSVPDVEGQLASVQDVVAPPVQGAGGAAIQAIRKETERQPTEFGSVRVHRDPVGGDSDPVGQAVATIVDALEGITTASDSAQILSQFQGQSAASQRAILQRLRAEASAHGETADVMIDWLFDDMTAEHASLLRQMLIRAGVHAEIAHLVVKEIYSRLSGWTSEADSGEIYALLVQYTGGGLDRLLADLAAHAEMTGPALGEWLFGDLDRANAERVRVHFLTYGATSAADYAAEFTASKIESLLAGYTGHADSTSILRNFQDTPERSRPTVQVKLDAKTRARWSQSAEDALMEDMDRVDFEAVRALGGVSLRRYDYTRTWYEKVISGAEWGMIVAEWIVCGVLGIVTGILSVLWDVVVLLADVVVAIWHLLWSLIYLLTGGAAGSENWLAVKQFFHGIGQVFTDPGTVWDQYWERVGLEYRTIEGPLTDCRRAEFIVRRFVNAVVNIILIFLGGYGLAKGIASAIKTVKAVARLRLLAGGVRNALRLVRLVGNGADDVARLETLLASPKVASVGELEALLSSSRLANAAELEALLASAKVQSAAQVQTLLGSPKLAGSAQLRALLGDAKVASATELQTLLDSSKVASGAELQTALTSAKIGTAAELQSLLARSQIGSLAEARALLAHPKVPSAVELDAVFANAKLTSAAELRGLLDLDKVSGLAEIQGLLSDAKIANVAELHALLGEAKIADAAQLQRVLGPAANVTELRGQLALVDDAAQLGRLQAAIGSSTEIERFIREAARHGADGIRFLDNMIAAGVAPRIAADALRIADDIGAAHEVMVLVNSGRLVNPSSLRNFLREVAAEVAAGQEGKLSQLREASRRAADGRRVSIEGRRHTPRDPESGQADIIDFTAREALQMKEVSSAAADKVATNCNSAINQLGGAGGELPPDGFRRIADVRVRNPDNPLFNADRVAVQAEIRGEIANPGNLNGPGAPPGELRVTNNTGTHVFGSGDL